MNLRFHIALAVGCVLGGAVGLSSQATPPTAQQKPPAPAQQQPAPPTEANPFPTDTTNDPVVPPTGEPAASPAPGASGAGAGTTSLLRQDTDPAHSPDDPAPDVSGETGFSSSLTGASDVNIPDEERP